MWKDSATSLVDRFWTKLSYSSLMRCGCLLWFSVLFYILSPCTLYYFNLILVLFWLPFLGSLFTFIPANKVHSTIFLAFYYWNFTWDGESRQGSATSNEARGVHRSGYTDWKKKFNQLAFGGLVLFQPVANLSPFKTGGLVNFSRFQLGGLDGLDG